MVYSRQFLTSIITLLWLGSFARPGLGAGTAISLQGSWRTALDRSDQGMEERWFARDLSETIELPGSLPQQGFGDKISLTTPWMGGVQNPDWIQDPRYAPYTHPDNFKFPFWLQPETYYAGAAWYQRDLQILESWRGQRIVLTLERPHWETRVWVDDRLLATNQSLSVPHVYELGHALSPGHHRLTVRVDNRMVVNVGHNSHSVSDHTQGNWNGLVGRLELTVTPSVWIEDLRVTPRLDRRSVTVRGRLGNVGGKAGRGQVTLKMEPVQGAANHGPVRLELPVIWTAEGGAFTAELGSALETWDEFQPTLYRLTARLSSEAGGHERGVNFGLREIRAEGSQLLLNDRKLFLRGTLECAIFPRTGHPPTDVASWRRVIQACQAHGLNHIRFHSWCPPEAAFEAADELGFYFQVECGSWGTLGTGGPLDRWLYEEADRILRAYGNHPSFLLMAYGNEPGGRNHRDYLAQWVAHYRAEDPRRLYTAASGWPQIAENQYHVTPDPRIQAWGNGLKSRINARPPETVTDYRDYIQARSVPVVSHEIGQWCVYPNFDEIPKYTGYLKPRNFEIFRELLNQHHLGGRARDFLLASGKLQTLCYKEDIESALRTPGMGGFQLLDLHDFPGQGTALVGVLDPFWESKGYVTPEAFRRFCNRTVPLARLTKRVFTQEEALEADVEVAHFGAAPLTNRMALWKLVAEDGEVVGGARWPARTIPVGSAFSLGRIRADLRNIPAPARYQLLVALDGTPFVNDWDVWVYPTAVETRVQDEITVAHELDDDTLSALQAGGKVLLLLAPDAVGYDSAHGRVALGFSSVFWNTAWTRGQAPHTLGVLCDPKHPALASFPTEFHSNWQWWYLVSRAGAMILDELPADLIPTVQVIDDWFTARKLGLVFEGRIGDGKLVVCSIDLERDLESNPVARQFRHSLLRYMSGESFDPGFTLNPEAIRRLTSPPSSLRAKGGRVRYVDSAQPDYEGERAVDGDPQTMWHTAWGEQSPPFPHEIQIVFEKPVAMRGITVLPRQDGQRNGWIKDYAVYVSDDGTEWKGPIVEGRLAAGTERKVVRFENIQTARYLRMVALSGHGAGPWTSLAELDLLTD